MTDSMVGNGDHAASLGAFRRTGARMSPHGFTLAGGAEDRREPEPSRLVAVAHSHMRRLARRTGATVLLAVEESGAVRCLEELAGAGEPAMRVNVGRCAPLASSVLGTALMLGMTRSRWAALHALMCLRPAGMTGPPTRGLALSGWSAFERRMIGHADRDWTCASEGGDADVCCVAAPVRDDRARVVAALGVSVAAADGSGETIADGSAETIADGSAETIAALGPAVRRAADALSREFGWMRHD